MLATQFACVYGFYVPHPESNNVVGPCVLLYFVTMIVYALYTLSIDNRDIVLKHKVRALLLCTVQMRVYGVVC